MHGIWPQKLFKPLALAEKLRKKPIKGNRSKTRPNTSSLRIQMVRKEGFEPPRPFGHKILSLARLPVPPLPQWYSYSTSLRTAAPLGFAPLFSLVAGQQKPPFTLDYRWG